MHSEWLPASFESKFCKKLISILFESLIRLKLISQKLIQVLRERKQFTKITKENCFNLKGNAT